MIDNQAKTHTNKHYFNNEIKNVGSSKYSTCAVNHITSAYFEIREYDEGYALDYYIKFSNSIEKFKNSLLAVFVEGSEFGRYQGRRMGTIRVITSSGGDSFDNVYNCVLDYVDTHTLKFTIDLCTRVIEELEDIQFLPRLPYNVAVQTRIGNAIRKGYICAYKDYGDKSRVTDIIAPCVLSKFRLLNHVRGKGNVDKLLIAMKYYQPIISI